MQNWILTAAAGIITLLLVLGGLALWSQGESGANVSTTRDQIYAMTSELRRKYSYQPNRFGTVEITNDNLIKMGAAPASLGVTAPLVNRWGGTVNVTGNVTTAFIDLGSVDAVGCVGLVTEGSPGGQIQSIRVGPSVSAAAASSPLSIPVDPATATSLCGATNGIRIEFR
jgi:hypothetical protein